MRHFNEKEKEILKFLDKLNGLRFETLLKDKFFDNKLIVDFEKKKSHIRYNTRSFTPTQAELSEIKRMANELHERIYLAVTLVNYFEKLGHVGLFRNQDKEQIIELGNKKLENNGLLTEVIDETINSLLVNYVGKVLIITSEFHEFIENNFLFKEELRHNQNIKLTWIAIIVAVTIGIISVITSIMSNLNPKVVEFHNDYKQNYIEKKILFDKLDSIFSSLNKTIHLNDSMLITNSNQQIKIPSDN